MARRFPGAARVLGLDLSTHFLAVGGFLQRAGASATQEHWVEVVSEDPRIEFLHRDIAETKLPPCSVSVAVDNPHKSLNNEQHFSHLGQRRKGETP